jgi:hypothetical protein
MVAPSTTGPRTSSESWSPSSIRSRCGCSDRAARGDDDRDSALDALVVLDNYDPAGATARKRQISRSTAVTAPFDVSFTGPARILHRRRVAGTLARAATDDGRLMYVAEPEPSPTEAVPWLAKADEDLTIAELVQASSVGVNWAACLYAQQAAEKALKALLVLLGIDLLAPTYSSASPIFYR